MSYILHFNNVLYLDFLIFIYYFYRLNHQHRRLHKAAVVSAVAEQQVRVAVVVAGRRQDIQDIHSNNHIRRSLKLRLEKRVTWTHYEHMPIRQVAVQVTIQLNQCT